MFSLIKISSLTLNEISELRLYVNTIFIISKKNLELINWDVVRNASTVDDKSTPLRPIKLKHFPAPWLTTNLYI